MPIRRARRHENHVNGFRIRTMLRPASQTSFATVATVLTMALPPSYTDSPIRLPAM